MAYKNGRFLIVKWGGVQLKGITTNSMNVEKNMIDVTNKDSAGWSEFLNDGDKTWTIEAEVIYDPTASEGAVSLLDDLINGVEATVYHGETASGGKYYSGTGFVKTVGTTSPNNDKVTTSISIQGTGALTPATV